MRCGRTILFLLSASFFAFGATGHGNAAEPGSETGPIAALSGAPASAAVELIRSPFFPQAGTVEVKGRRLGLAGIAATPLDLQCGAGTDAWPCGRAARTALQGFVRGRTLACEAAEAKERRCAVGGRDLGEWLVAQGWAAAAGDLYRKAEATARQELRGIWNPKRAERLQAAGIATGTGDAVLRAEVELSIQSMTVTYRGEVIGNWPVSTAREGKETPTGVWTAKWLSRDHRSRLYDGAPMPFSIFFEGDYAIHGTNQTRRLGQPASHGCVRLSPSHAKRLFDLAAREGVENTLVVIRP